MRIKEIKNTCQEPLGEREKCAVYKIPCVSPNSLYVGETYGQGLTRQPGTSKEEHSINGETDGQRSWAIGTLRYVMSE